MTSLLFNYRRVSRGYSWGAGLYYTLFCILLSTIRGGRDTGPAHTQAFPQAPCSTATPKPRACLYCGWHLPHRHCPCPRAPGGKAAPAIAIPHCFPGLGHVYQSPRWTGPRWPQGRVAAPPARCRNRAPDLSQPAINIHLVTVIRFVGTRLLKAK